MMNEENVKEAFEMVKRGFEIQGERFLLNESEMLEIIRDVMNFTEKRCMADV